MTYSPFDYTEEDIRRNREAAYQGGWDDGYAEGLGKGKQTRKMSFVESWANTVFGFVISVAASFLIFPLIGVQTTGVQNVLAVIAFTFISVARNYIVRRVFTRL